MKQVQQMIQEGVDGKGAEDVVRVVLEGETQDPEPEEKPEDAMNRAKEFLDAITKTQA